MKNDLWPLVAAALCAIALMPLAMRAKVLDGHHFSNPQNLHTQPTSRLGGAILFLAYAAGIASTVWLVDVPNRLMFLVLASALPAFAAGVFEDVTHWLTPRQRLLAALASAVLASWLASGIIARLDVPYVDGWLQMLPFVLPVTWFMVTGACNALNLIDGVHGLAGGTAFLMFGGIAIAAGHVGDRVVLIQALTMIGALGGFLYWNYPRGRVFLGDGGAYFVGFVYAQLSIEIVARNDHISAWFVVMLAAYPIMETLYSIYRRKIIQRTPSMQPDSLHLHSLIYRQVAQQMSAEQPQSHNDRINGRVAPRLWLHGAICFALALGFHANTAALLAGILAYALFYCAHYALLLRKHEFWADLRPAVLKEERDVNIRLS